MSRAYVPVVRRLRQRVQDRPSGFRRTTNGSGALYLWLAVGGASAAIIGTLALVIALSSGCVAYAVAYTKVTGKRAPGAVRVNALAGYRSRDIRVRR